MAKVLLVFELAMVDKLIQLHFKDGSLVLFVDENNSRSNGADFPEAHSWWVDLWICGPNHWTSGWAIKADRAAEKPKNISSEKFWYQKENSGWTVNFCHTSVSLLYLKFPIITVTFLLPLPWPTDRRRQSTWDWAWWQTLKAVCVIILNF